MEQGYEFKLTDYQEAGDKQSYSDIYIPLQGKHTTNPEEEPFDLAEKIKEFFIFDKTNPSDPLVMLLMGDTGSGKSVFAQQIFQQLTQGRREGDPIPVWIPLPELLNPFEGAVEEVLQKQGFSDVQITQMKANERFIFIVDGYDELHQFQNCYMTNKWNQWQAKVLMTCRSQALYYQKDPDKYFVPFNGEKRVPWLLRKLYVAAFSPGQIKAYVEQYNKITAQSGKRSQDEDVISMDDFDKIPSLKELIDTPFLLHLAVEALPDILAEQQSGQENQKMTQAKLYDVFIERWFVRQIQKLQTTGQLTENPEKTKQRFWDFCKKLAQQMHANEMSVIPYTQQKVGGRLFGKKQTNTWESFFNEQTEVLRSACPLKKMGEHHYGFIHASFVEYFATRAMYEEIQEITEAKELHKDDECKEEAEAVLENTKTKKPKGGIHYRVFAKERNAIRNLADRIEMKKQFKEKMLALVEHSKTDERYAIGAANAITALVRAGVTFNSVNLAGVRIGGADVSGGYFANVNLAGSDLRDVILAKTYLSEANLRGCLLEGINFHEYPWFKQDSEVKAMDYRADLSRLVTGCQDNINLWDIQTQNCIKVLTGHEDRVNCLHFSSDGRRVVSGSKDKTVRVWDLETGKANVLLGHEDTVSSVRFNNDSRQVVSGSADKTVRVWNLVSGLANVLRGHESEVTCVQFSGDSRLVVSSGSWDCSVRVWDVVSGEAKLLLGHEKIVRSVDFSGDGRHVVSGSMDRTVRVWDVASGHEKVLRGHTDTVYSVKFSNDGRQVVSGSADKTVRVWDVETGKANVLHGHEKMVLSVQFSNLDQQVVSGSFDNTLRMWDVVSGKQSILRGHTGFVFCVHFSNDGQQVVTGSSDQTVRVWDIECGQAKILRGHKREVLTAHFSGDGRHVVSGGKDKIVRVWNLDTGEAKILSGHEGTVWTARFSGDGRKVVSGSDDKTLRVWDVQNGKAKVLRGHENWVLSVQFSGNGQQMVSCGDETIRVWDVDSYEAKVLRGHENTVWTTRFSGDGRKLVSVSKDNTVRVWDLGSGEAIELRGHKFGVECVDFSCDGRLVVSGSRDNTIRVWNLCSGETKVLLGHEDRVDNVQFSSDSSQVVSCGDNSVRVWNIEREEEVRRITFYTRVSCFSLHEEKSLLCLGLADGTVQCWRRTEASWASLRLKWSSSYPNHLLFLRGCDTQESKGLSQMNRHLLEQRDGIVEEKLLSTSSEIVTEVSRRTGSPLHQSPQGVQEPGQQSLYLEEISREELK